MKFANHPRFPLFTVPTALEPLPNLSAALGGPEIWVKRDDTLPLAMGGNKVRKLEFLVADALAAGADTLVTCGAVQSNHTRLTAAAARRAGLRCDVALVERVARQDEDYELSGNSLLLDLLGAGVHRFPASADTDLAGAMAEVAERVKSNGGKPYIVPEGGGSPVGGLGYAAAALELVQQCNALNIDFDHAVVGSGSGGTHAGLLAGLHALGVATPVTGMCVRRDALTQKTRIEGLVPRIAALIGHAAPPAGVVQTDDSAMGPGYGVLTDAVREAIRLTAETEGLLLDPVYTGKVMAGLIGLIRGGALARGQRVLFIHTGGTPGLFAYRGGLARENSVASKQNR
jgi:D-cysteine desulfhydrase family pyridoxal phosphate-dependent enzyme